MGENKTIDGENEFLKWNTNGIVALLKYTDRMDFFRVF